jgi:RNA polymerase sigma-70 factor (ECF subfamily)
MKRPRSTAETGNPERKVFPVTNWSTILEAGHTDSPAARDALGRLYEIYRPALLGFIRSWSGRSDKAEDLLQGFFAHLLASAALNTVRRQGRFRSWLLACLKHYVSNCIAYETAKIRAPREAPVPIGESNETGCVQPTGRELAADQEYDRQFAIAFLGGVVALMEKEYAGRGRQSVFEALLPVLQNKKAGFSHAELGRPLGMNENAVAQEVSRMRKRYRELFKEELIKLCGSEHFQEEQRHLFAALSE